MLNWYGAWYAAQLRNMSNYVDPKELIHAKQWADGMAFCAVLAKYRPQLMWVYFMAMYIWVYITK